MESVALLQQHETHQEL